MERFEVPASMPPNNGKLAAAINGTNAAAQASLAQAPKERVRRPVQHTLSRAVGLIDRVLAPLSPQRRLEVLDIITKDALAAAEASRLPVAVSTP